MGILIQPLVVAFILSLILTPIVRKLAIKIGAIDIPKDERRVHKKPIPLMGGLAMYISLVISVLIFMDIDKSILALLIGASLILIAGLIDDIKELSPKAKLAFQIGAALVLVWGDVRIEATTNPFTKTQNLIELGFMSVPVTVFWIVGITNTLNLIDGLDGLAAGVASISALSFLFVGLKFHYNPIVILSAITAGSALGFLPYNFNPASIFMGDTGALFLGFILSYISIEGVMKSVATIAFVVPIIILGVPIFDTAFAICRRWVNGKPIMEADKGHLHHRLLKLGFSQKKTVLILYGISAVFGISAILISKMNSKRAVLGSVIVFLVTIILAGKLGLYNKKEDCND